MFRRIFMAALAVMALEGAALAQQAAQPSPDDRARQWLTLLDNANYSQAWTDAGAAFRADNKNGAWAADTAKLREPMGAMVSRDLKDVKLSGSTATVRYDSSFAQKARMMETVTLSLKQPDGWSVTGYKMQASQN